MSSLRTCQANLLQAWQVEARRGEGDSAYRHDEVEEKLGRAWPQTPHWSRGQSQSRTQPGAEGRQYDARKGAPVSRMCSAIERTAWESRSSAPSALFPRVQDRHDAPRPQPAALRLSGKDGGGGQVNRRVLCRVSRKWVEAIKPPSEKPMAISGSLDGRPRTERTTALRTRTSVITL